MNIIINKFIIYNFIKIFLKIGLYIIKILNIKYKIIINFKKNIIKLQIEKNLKLIIIIKKIN